MKNALLIFLLIVSTGLKTKAQDSVSCFDKNHTGFFLSLSASFSTERLDIPTSLAEYNSTLPEPGPGFEYGGYKRISSTKEPGVGYSLGYETQSAVNKPLFVVFDAGFSGYDFGGKVTDQYYTARSTGAPGSSYTTTYSSPQTTEYYYSLEIIEVSLRLYCKVYKIKNGYICTGLGGHLGAVWLQDNSGQTTNRYYYNIGALIGSACIRYSYKSHLNEFHTIELYYNMSANARNLNTGYYENYCAIGLQFVF